ncbi:MAG: hypothetical protein MI865_09080, partial [Proteobacteria bacterium]|nr:hypothetical protein [Pseudomonadota bacterium]
MTKTRFYILLILSAIALMGCIRIGDLVWFDANGNGLQDPGEEGMHGVEMTLYDAEGNVVDIRSTNFGFYNFGGDPGSYYVEVTVPEGYAITQRDAPSTLRGIDPDEIDSDVDPVTGQSDLMNMTFFFLVTDRQVDVGLVMLPEEEEEAEPETSNIDGYAWVDANHDGLQDAEEGALENVGVNLFVDGESDPLQETQTDADGLYQFQDVEVG